jgi:hypothetical protein
VTERLALKNKSAKLVRQLPSAEMIPHAKSINDVGYDNNRVSVVQKEKKLDDFAKDGSTEMLVSYSPCDSTPTLQES